MGGAGNQTQEIKGMFILHFNMTKKCVRISSPTKRGESVYFPVPGHLCLDSIGVLDWIAFFVGGCPVHYRY